MPLVVHFHYTRTDLANGNFSQEYHSFLLLPEVVAISVVVVYGELDLRVYFRGPLLSELLGLPPLARARMNHHYWTDRVRESLASQLTELPTPERLQQSREVLLFFSGPWPAEGHDACIRAVLGDNPPVPANLDIRQRLSPQDPLTVNRSTPQVQTRHTYEPIAGGPRSPATWAYESEGLRYLNPSDEEIVQFLSSPIHGDPPPQEIPPKSIWERLVKDD